MPRFLSFMIFMFLKLVIVFTQSIYMMVLNVCYTIEVLFQLNYELIDNIPESSTTKTHAVTETLNDTGVLTKTALADVFPGYVHRKSSNTDILVYNLSSSRKICIKHKTLKEKSTKSSSCNPCEMVKPEVKQFNDIGLQTSKLTINNDNTYSVTNFDSSQHMNSINSNMSVDENTINSQIILHSSMVFPDSKILTEELINKSKQCEVQENEENIPPRQTPVKFTKERILEHQTPSPVGYWSKLPSADQLAEFDTAFHNPQNAIESDEIQSQFLKSASEFRTSDQFNKSSSVLENTVLLDHNVKQRLSLSPNTKNSAAKAAALSLKSIQDEIIEFTRNTPRYEKNKKEIKFPYTPEISNLLQTVDDKEEAKERFSCSSYESLPISDHIRTAFERSIVSSLYTENFTNITEPDFSSVDSLVEAFRKLESTISVCEPAKNRISERYIPSDNSKNTFVRNLSVEFLEMNKRQNQHNMRKAVSSGMLYNSSTYQNSLEKDKFARDLTESEYQNLAPVNNDFKSRTSSLSSVLNDEISANEIKESECNKKSEKSDLYYTLNENTKDGIDAKTNLVIDNVCLSDHKETCKNNSRTVESNVNYSDPVLNVKTKNILEHNQENEVLIGKSTQKVNFKYPAEPEPVVTENVKLISSMQESTDKRNQIARKSFTGCRNKVRQKSDALLSSISPNRNINKCSSVEHFELEHFKTCSMATDSVTSKDLHKSENIENKECLKIDEMLLNVEKSTNSSDLDDTQNIQSIMNNDINDKYKFAFIEDEIPRTPENK